jgi:phosphoribosylformimino-5-aminoimidazole carboxamide ribotide isomerase
MILFPAIDLKDGQCVRLERGDMGTATVFNADPAAQARAFADAGFQWLHIVDLNGAFAGHSVNGDAVRAILEAVDLRVQLGGGIRNMKHVTAWLGGGVERVILGTAAVRDPEFVRKACRAAPGRIAVGIDARDGRVAVSGWAETSDMAAVDLARRFEDAGVAAINHTDISRDGMLQGLNLDASLALAEAVSIPVVASGGFSGMDDIHRLMEPRYRQLAGAIAGRALYEGGFTATEGLTLLGKLARTH